MAEFGRSDREYCNDACKARSFRRRRAGLAEDAPGARGIPFAARVRREPESDLEPVFFAGRVARVKIVREIAMNQAEPADIRHLAGLLGVFHTWAEIGAELQCSPEQLKHLLDQLERRVDRWYTAESNMKLKSFSRGRTPSDPAGGSESSAIEAWEAAEALGEVFAPVRDSVLP